MNAKELADKLSQHPDAEIMIFGDDMSSSAIDKVVYDEPQNVFYIYMY